MTLKESLQSVVRSGFTVKSPLTRIQLYKNKVGYIVKDHNDIVTYSELEWNKAFAHFLSSHLIKLRDEDPTYDE